LEISSTFEIIKHSLYSVRYSNYGESEFRRLFNLWNDASALFEFFQEHENELNSPFWNGISIEQAVLKTRKDAFLFEEKVLTIAQKGKLFKTDGLSSFFKPLSQGNLTYKFEKDKAKGPSQKSWLRLYAIRIDSNLFLISGGGIKLTQAMNESELLLKELDKLELVRKYLNDDQSSFFELYEIE